jgi:hypothetical protein
MRKKIDWTKVDEQNAIQSKINLLLENKDSNNVIDVMLLTCARILGEDFEKVAKSFTEFVKEEEAETA